MPFDPEKRFPLMCLTLEGSAISHAAQVEDLCAAGAKWIQLRMKGASEAAWLSEAERACAACKESRAVFIVNDSVEVARESGADGVHLGSLDLDWASARRRLGPGFLIGGTVNNAGDARRAVDSGCLDYVGVGPLRFTSTKTNLSPVLGLARIAELVSVLGNIPAWVIGGVEPGDMRGIREAGAAGVAVSSALWRDGMPARSVREFLAAWQEASEPAHPLAP